MAMHQPRIQRTLIAYIKRGAPEEWAVQRVELRRAFTELMACIPSHAARRNFGRIYAQHKAVMVVKTARYISKNR
ncbi:hypothetical protein OOT33_00085 [Sphingobium sp. DEHP117]|uniref:hypothetical protein n=1 Tax=Sphingobium sp. DEHP117 TaxID=2993436 RepID=UPI0027D65D8C|nr:hypothetical protein [Sphingobium sp. DEHP117]MDQ4418845.1 hypothetical protein [Sphingobium sp. DEHP117]